MPRLPSLTPIMLASAAHSATIPNLWLTWTLDPTLISVLAVMLGGYFYLSGPGRRRWGRAAEVNRRQALWFVAGWVVLALALVSPLDTLGDD